MLTAHKTEVDRIVGYASGADDYIEKPFSPQELPVRLRAVTRRLHQKPFSPAQTSSATTAQLLIQICSTLFISSLFYYWIGTLLLPFQLFC
jgi:DNA-binding response OmpR family regulator